MASSCFCKYFHSKRCIKQHLPFQIPFWQTKRNCFACHFNFSLKTVLYFIQHIKNTINFHPLFTTFRVYGYDNIVFPFFWWFTHQIGGIKKKAIVSHEMNLLHIYVVENSGYLRPVIFHLLLSLIFFHALLMSLPSSFKFSKVANCDSPQLASSYWISPHQILLLIFYVLTLPP